jgi:hypothetical protein
MDRLYEVTWKAGNVHLHASSKKEAMEIAAEYLRDGRINATVLIPLDPIFVPVPPVVPD